ncbi:hypothetical protein GCM10023084_78600 [Streptomyces lacrimifluminis]|uniref:Secreted protein n=1 Tax=Streptomyces lacrimifluminis TaxID=1500077 RepID=A0A917P585_9ACTN|nr:hypothetical protein [Streptomyces lacrimifluminis]GGJ62246.1 hypothetical protein GCM10012282_69340 [Streptomyces lacrimifluminis]
MPALPARRIASTALCATFLLGIGAPAALAADGDAARERGHVASQAPVPNADALLAQVKSLGDLGGVLKPVTDLLAAVLKADNGQLPLDEATKLGDAVKAAIAAATAAAPVPATPPVSLPATPEVPAAPALPATPEVPATPVLPEVPAAPALPATPEVPATPALPAAPEVPATLPVALPATPATPAAPEVPALPATPVLPVAPALPPAPALPLSLKDAKAGKGPLDIKGDALAVLQKSVDTLLKAVTSGDVANVVPAVTGVLTSLVGFVAATLLGGGLPAPDLAGLPPLPKLPVEVPPLPVPVPPLPLPAR